MSTATTTTATPSVVDLSVDAMGESNTVSNERVIKLANGDESFVKRSSVKDPSRTAGLTNLYFENSHLSKLHAVIKQIDGSFYVKDLDSTFGTILNGHFIFSNKFFKLNTDDMLGFIISKPSASISKVFEKFERNEKGTIPLSEFSYPQVALEFIISIENDVIKFLPLSSGKSSVGTDAKPPKGISQEVPIDADDDKNEAIEIEDDDAEEVRNDQIVVDDDVEDEDDNDDDDDDEEEEEDDYDEYDEDDSFCCRAMAGTIQRYDPPQYSGSDVSVDDDSQSNDSKTLIIGAEASDSDASSADISFTKESDLREKDIKTSDPGQILVEEEGDDDGNKEVELEEREEEEEEEDYNDDEEEEEDDDDEDSADNFQDKDSDAFDDIEVVKIEIGEISKDVTSGECEDGFSEEVDTVNEDSEIEEDDDDEDDEEEDDEEEDDEEDEEEDEEDDDEEEDEEEEEGELDSVSSVEGSECNARLAEYLVRVKKDGHIPPCISPDFEEDCELHELLVAAKRTAGRRAIFGGCEFTDGDIYTDDEIAAADLRSVLEEDVASSDENSYSYANSEEESSDLDIDSNSDSGLSVDSKSSLDSESSLDSSLDFDDSDNQFGCLFRYECPKGACNFGMCGTQPNSRKRTHWEIEGQADESIVDEPAKKKEKKEPSYLKVLAQEAGKGLFYILATVFALGVYGSTISPQK